MGGALDRPLALRGLLQKTTPGLARHAEQTPVRQLAAALASALRKGEGSVTLRLSPEHLGPMRVELGLTAGEVSARFLPTTKSARDLLINSEPALRSALEARGLEVARIEIATLPIEGSDPSRGGADANIRGEDPRTQHTDARAGGPGHHHAPSHDPGNLHDSGNPPGSRGSPASAWQPPPEAVEAAAALLEPVAPALGHLGVSVLTHSGNTLRLEAFA